MTPRTARIARFGALMLALSGCDRSFNSNPNPEDEPEPERAARDAEPPTNTLLRDQTLVETTAQWSPQLQLSDRDGELVLRARDLPAVTRDGRALVALRIGGNAVERFQGATSHTVDLVIYNLPALTPAKTFALRSPKTKAEATTAAVGRANAAMAATAWRALQQSDDGHNPTAVYNSPIYVDDLTMSSVMVGGLTLLKVATRDGRAAYEKDISSWLGKKLPKGCKPAFANVAASADVGAMYMELDWLGEKLATKCPGRAAHYVAWVPIPN